MDSLTDNRGFEMITGTIGIMIGKTVVTAVMGLIAAGLFFGTVIEPESDADRQEVVEMMEE